MLTPLLQYHLVHVSGFFSASAARARRRIDPVMSQGGVSCKGKPHPEAVQRTLLSLYQKGMTGWGQKYEPFLMTASEKTGLTVAQIKVC